MPSYVKGRTRNHGVAISHEQSAIDNHVIRMDKLHTGTSMCNETEESGSDEVDLPPSLFSHGQESNPTSPTGMSTPDRERYRPSEYIAGSDQRRSGHNNQDQIVNLLGLVPVVTQDTHLMPREVSLDELHGTSSEARTALRSIGRAFVPEGQIISGRQHAVNYHGSRGPFTKLLHNDTASNLLCGSDGPFSPSALPGPSSRHIRLHEKNRVIQRFQPGRAIHFRLDHATFTRAGLTDRVVKLIENAAIHVLTTINRQHLGVAFAYTPQSTSSVFDIRYRHDLAPLAAAFFPSDPRHKWTVEVSRLALFDADYLGSLSNILAHEFMHVLGMRHWNAGTVERDETSLCWPGTRDGERRGIMTTDAHPRDIWFDQKDFDMIRAFYRKANGARVEYCTIVDVRLGLTYDEVEQLKAVQCVWT